MEDDRIKILLAEDEEINFLYINEVLNSAKFDVAHAWNGKEAIEIFKKNSTFDIVLMDIKMPLIDGYGALKELKKINKEIPVIALTAHALSGDKEKVLSAGFDAYLSKPVSENKLLDMIYEFKKV